VYTGNSLWETYCKATEHQLPYGITQCYLPPKTGERAHCLNPSHTGWHWIYTPKGWKAELTLV